MTILSKTTLVLALFSVGAIASAQKVPISKNGYVSKLGAPKKGLTAQDMQFIKDAAAGNQFEVRTSEIAMKNGSSAFVKQFAKEMIIDHSAAFEELKVVARKKGVMVSKKLPAPKQAIVDKLSRLRGAAFDAAYQKVQKDAHAETAAKLKKQIAGGHDSDIKNYAVTTLPAVEHHAMMLAMKRTMMGKTKM